MLSFCLSKQKGYLLLHREEYFYNLTSSDATNCLWVQMGWPRLPLLYVSELAMDAKPLRRIGLLLLITSVPKSRPLKKFSMSQLLLSLLSSPVGASPTPFLTIKNSRQCWDNGPEVHRQGNMTAGPRLLRC